MRDFVSQPAMLLTPRLWSSTPSVPIKREKFVGRIIVPIPMPPSDKPFPWEPFPWERRSGDDRPLEPE